MVCKYLSPLISHRIGSVFQISIWISVFRRKKLFRNLFIGFGDIKQTNILTFFLKHPVVKSFYDARRHLYPKLLVKQMAEDRYHQDKAFNRLKSFDNKHNKRSIFKNNDFVHLGVHPVGLSSGFVYLFSGKCSFSTSFFSAKYF